MRVDSSKIYEQYRAMSTAFFSLGHSTPKEHFVLDEPTANVDGCTDALLQEAVSISFNGATILAVAHCLDTVIDYQKILVLGKGKVLEYGLLHELIMKGGAFCCMVDDTDEEMASDLKAQAKYSFDQGAQ
jgi:ABC-type transport system involved in cytochrome bd biosynthesis fused ATPase/permease subunit